MKNTNFQNLRDLLKSYKPKTFGIATVEGCNLIRNSLQLEGMEVVGASESTGLCCFILFKEKRG